MTFFKNIFRKSFEVIIISRLEEEYQRIKGLFEDADEKQLKLIDGAIVEAARIKVELDDLHMIVKETGLIKTNPKNKAMQKELPISKMIIKARANYLNYITKLATYLGVKVDDEDDEEMKEYE
ncbi:MAG: zinc-binding protein [Clostridium sp.]|nr:zinc-binding protein [Clostridium sp.]